ncbi:MAG: hypothetical protein ACTSVI_07580 [Promethearchaeota archaeon]
MAKKKKSAKKKLTAKELKSFTISRLSTVRLLLGENKVLEAMVYLFKIITWLVQNKHNIKRTQSTTVKEYFTDLVIKEIVPPDLVHPFVNLMEEALYSHHELPIDIFNSYKEKWAALYKNIVGDMPPSF